MRLAEQIVAQTQPTPNTCTATVIAMALGIPVVDLGVRLDTALGFEDFGVWLAERGIWLRPCVWSGRHGERMSHGSLYCVSVRSRNLVGSDHALLLDTRHGDRADPWDDEKWITYDPNAGREGLKLYHHVSEYWAVAFWQLKEREGPLHLEPPT